MRAPRSEDAQAVAVRIERDEGVAEIHLGRRLAIGRPRLLQSAWVASTASASVDREGDLAAAGGRGAAGSTVWRDQRPSITPVGMANIAKVGDASTGGAPSSSA